MESSPPCTATCAPTVYTQHSQPVGAIIGGVFACVAVLLLVYLAFLFGKRRSGAVASPEPAHNVSNNQGVNAGSGQPLVEHHRPMEPFAFGPTPHTNTVAGSPISTKLSLTDHRVCNYAVVQV